MAANQAQIRRDSNTNLMAATPADGELGYDQTNKRPVVGDGAKAGGHPLATWTDVQGQVFTAVTAGGTADAITLTFTTQLIPSGYAARQRFAFIASATNTGSATIDINTIGTVTLKKNQQRTLANLEAGDITSGRCYDIMHDGTYFVLMNSGAGVPDAGVTNASLEDAAVGDYISAMAFADDSDTSPGTFYAKRCELIAPRDGTYRVRIRVSCETSLSSIYGKAYVDGVAAGTELEVNSATAINWRNDDIAVNAGQLIQLYLKGSGSSAAYANLVNNIPGIAIMEAAPINGGALYTTEWNWQ